MTGKRMPHAVQFTSVVFKAESMELLSHGRTILSIPKKEILRITLKYGYQSERPLAQVLFGIALILVGLYFLLDFLLQIAIHRTVYGTMLLSILLLPLGGWFSIDGLRQRYYFEVRLDHDTRKFPLDRQPDTNQLQEFIQRASKLGYVIDATLLDSID